MEIWAWYYVAMPSWNIHTAHVEHLLKQGTPEEFGIKDANAFLFGNFVPDVYVGYMVKHPTGILPYTTTHLANPHAIPIPREQEFWDTYIEPTREIPEEIPVAPVDISLDDAVAILVAGGVYIASPSAEQRAALQERLFAPDYVANDVTLGTWAHLLCDSAYNTATHEWLQRYDVPSGEKTRIRKQNDFDLYGLTLPITLTCEINDELIRQAAAFPQYKILARDVMESVEAADTIVLSNQAYQKTSVPGYDLFTKEFFADIYAKVNGLLETRLRAYAQRRAG